jgi:hypothetical protein
MDLETGEMEVSNNSSNASVATSGPSPAPTQSTPSSGSESAKLASLPCDDSLLQNVYNPQRLFVKQLHHLFRTQRHQRIDSRGAAGRKITSKQGHREQPKGNGCKGRRICGRHFE